MAALPSPPADPQPSGPLAGADEPPAGAIATMSVTGQGD